MNMKFDDFLATVGDWGRFQKVKYTLICLTYMLPPIMVYTYTFTAAVPESRCVNPMLLGNDSFSEANNMIFEKLYKLTDKQCETQLPSVSVKECKRCYRTSNQSSYQNASIQRCDAFVFDKTYYQKTLVEEWTMICDRITYRPTAQMIFFVGYMVGSLLFGMLADKYGRRPIMSISFVLMSLAGFLCAFGPQEAFGFWPSYIIFSFARFLLACSTRGISVSGFVLGSEIVGPDKRLLTGIVIEYFFAFGQLFLVLFAYFIRTWRTLTWSISLFTVPFILFYKILPESPRWLVSKGHFDQAEVVLRDIAKQNDKTFDADAFEQLKANQKKTAESQQNQEGVLSLFRSKIMLIISLNLFFQWLAQNLVFYGVSQNTGAWEMNPYLSFVVSALVELAAYVAVHLILDRIGRKIPYCSFAILFTIFAISIIPIQTYLEKDSKIQRYLMGIINAALKFFASGSYAIIYIYANELFPTNARNTGMGICSMVARVGAIIGTFCNDYLTRIWAHLPIILYGLVSLVAALLALMFPETLNKPLPQSVADVESMDIVSCCRQRQTDENTQEMLPEGQPLTNKQLTDE